MDILREMSKSWIALNEATREMTRHGPGRSLSQHDTLFLPVGARVFPGHHAAQGPDVFSKTRTRRNVMRKSLLLMAGCMLASTGVARAADIISDATLAQCFVKSSSSTATIAPKSKTGPFRIAFSNSLY